ncbi:hypothetical protein [Chromobacterium phragmitis]|uniref:Chorismate lyase n=2 Tax=Chromobacterium phragmitis TaxID=2202141 RepID=A0A344UGE1_9NEIS|nr:hypothetical protein [Chromobacterium phragmitis]AXE34339.1 hypothetical protein DK843_08555 [Chromobacterium phragmitis]
MRLDSGAARRVFPPQWLADDPQAGAIDIPWREAEPVAPEAICVCSRDALVHQGYMTGALQRSRHCRLRIRRLWQRHDARRLERLILLLDEGQRCHVAAWIRIELLAFEPRWKRRLVESDLPFGAILEQAGIRPAFADRRYFRLPRLFPWSGMLAYRRCCGDHYGRGHRMLGEDGRLLAEVREVLP